VKVDLTLSLRDFPLLSQGEGTFWQRQNRVSIFIVRFVKKLCALCG
jgi:hypothetical protein